MFSLQEEATWPHQGWAGLRATHETDVCRWGGCSSRTGPPATPHQHRRCHQLPARRPRCSVGDLSASSGQLLPSSRSSVITDGAGVGVAGDWACREDAAILSKA